ncbi:protein of unknown function [Pseudomonas sp. JV551A1]|uniref:Uncharacterized protein n=1 Tax=Pseudomonas inefficax TaxID=2078786 RepID=A0AAQ1SWE7_9PSED|nr:protein of unknown function [Pseudomonas sp. JV551A1]SPO64073.1 protein of unknown function [Pseudomonas inefficax]
MHRAQDRCMGVGMAGPASQAYRDTRPLPQDAARFRDSAVPVGAALCRERAAQQPQWL